MIDCHCHLADNQFKSDIERVIERAKQSNVLATLVCSEYRQQFSKVFELAEKFPDFCFPCLGVHPIQVSNLLYFVLANFSLFNINYYDLFRLDKKLVTKRTIFISLLIYEITGLEN